MVIKVPNLNDQKYTFTAPVRMIYPHLFEPHTYKDKSGKAKGDPKYSASFIVPEGHPDLQPLQALAVRIFEAEWPGKAPEAQFFPLFKSGTKMADEAVARGQKKEELRGSIIFYGSSAKQPNLSVITDGRLLNLFDEAALAMHKGKFYPGVECYPSVLLTAFTVGLTGVNAYLNNLLSINSGERIQGERDAAKVYAHVAGGLSTVDPRPAAGGIPGLSV